VGIAGLTGAFERGDTVRVLGPEGDELARGICNYGVEDLARIRGRRSDEIEAVLGYHFGDAFIHRDDLALL
ncbi:MAG TPA: glutamate 5-kinase, partial [Anaerolineales bacterium]|nr:glutamate 5-kinase [Anaerolineales bacterium]